MANHLAELVDVGAIESALGGIDPSRPEAIAELMSSGVFEPPTTPEQQTALDRLEVLLALIEGWVDEVTALAAADRLPAFDALRETMRRRPTSSSGRNGVGSIENVSTGPAVCTQVSWLAPPRCIDTLLSSLRATRVMPPGSTCQRPRASAIA